MLQKELAKRLRGRLETEPGGDGWLAVRRASLSYSAKAQQVYKANCCALFFYS